MINYFDEATRAHAALKKRYTDLAKENMLTFDDMIKYTTLSIRLAELAERTAARVMLKSIHNSKKGKAIIDDIDGTELLE